MKTKYLSSILLFLILIIGCRKDQDDAPLEPAPPIYTNGSGVIGSIGGTVTINDPASPLNGVKVIIPKGALDSDKTIQITEAPESVNFPGDSTQQLIRFLPAGLNFLKPITIELPYVGNDTTKLGIFYYDPETESISEIEKEKIDMVKKTISGLTDHFSYYTAWIATVGMSFNMIRTDGDKIGVRLYIFGYDESNNALRGFKYIPTTWNYQFAGKYNAWDILSNTGYSQVYSVFGISLMEDGLIWNTEVDFGRYAIQRVQQFSGGSFQVDLYKENENQRFYGSGDLFTEDIGEGYKNMGRWITGEPLIFLFDDFEPDPNKKYFIKVWWVLSSDRNGTFSKYCPSYELNNKRDKQKINDMQSVILVDIDFDNNLVWDDFQVWGISAPPVCDFVANKTDASTGESIQFSDQSSNDPTDWSWNFGDGGTSTQKNPTHSYNQPGVYSVSLTVTNPFGTDTKIRENYITVSTAPFIEVLVPNGGEEWSKGTEYEITWNDNLQENVKINLIINTNIVFTIAYNAESNGNFNWTIPTTIPAGTNYKIRIQSVVNGTIRDQSADIFAIVENILPIAEFSATPTSGETPLTVNFDDNSTNEPTSWFWIFGDGGTSTQQNPIHTYNFEGVFNVQLTAYNNYGSDSELKTNYISVTNGNGGSGTVTDPRDGQTYNTVVIGNQTWFAENLNYETNDSWWYDNDPTNGDIYGRLYTWDAANNACPNGWHLPSDEEWKTLEMFLGMSQSEADKTDMWRGTDEGLKLKNTSGWDNNGNGNNSSGFTALPAGYIYRENGEFIFYVLGEFAFFWSDSESSSTDAFDRGLVYNKNEVYRGYHKKINGFSVRCLKN